MSDFTAAILYAHLLEIDTITNHRRNIWFAYHDFFSQICSTEVQLIKTDSNTQHNGHLYAIFTKSLEARNNVIQKLSNFGIMGVSHYQALHLSKGGSAYGTFQTNLINSQKASETIIRLPMWSYNTPIDSILSKFETHSQELFEC